MPFTISINAVDNASASLSALASLLGSDELAARVGDAEVALFQNHFRANGSNKQGWPTTSFWARAAAATTWQAVDGGVAISVNQTGVRQRWQGGTITPRGRTFLTIPARAEAYGKTAAEFNHLRVAYGRHGAFALVEADASNKSSGKKGAAADITGGGVYFWLVRSVFQAPDPSVMPADSEISGTACDAISSFLHQSGGPGGAR